ALRFLLTALHYGLASLNRDAVTLVVAGGRVGELHLHTAHDDGRRRYGFAFGGFRGPAIEEELSVAIILLRPKRGVGIRFTGAQAEAFTAHAPALAYRGVGLPP